MTIQQIESKAGILLAFFGTAFADSVVTTIQAGKLPQTWPEIQHVLANAALAASILTFGWVKMKSPVSPQAQAAQAQASQSQSSQ